MVIEALQCGSVTLVGHGMGAMVALELALRQPALVRRLVLCAGGPVLDAQATQDWVAPRLAALDAGPQEQGGGGRGAPAMEQLADALVPRFIGTGALPEGVRLARHALSQVYPGTYRRALLALSTFDRGAAQLRRLAAPALVISGGQDRCNPPAAMEALAHVLLGAELVRLPHVGHWPQLEDPEGFDAALLAFLAGPARVLH